MDLILLGKYYVTFKIVILHTTSIFLYFCFFNLFIFLSTGYYCDIFFVIDNEISVTIKSIQL